MPAVQSTWGGGGGFWGGGGCRLGLPWHSIRFTYHQMHMQPGMLGTQMIQALNPDV